jgi:hypothetical protein
MLLISGIINAIKKLIIKINIYFKENAKLLKWFLQRNIGHKCSSELLLSNLFLYFL